ncbi:MAG: FAD-dependent oxidoreductase [Hamadaea sp.]|nr:FAD-dependent oxidoreductase [Hamadaea sp.]
MATHPRSDVLIVGAGVSGLSTAVCLADAGFSVRVVAELPPEWTTSAKAGASWGPYLMTHPQALDWCLETFHELSRLAEIPGSGIAMVNGIEAAKYEIEPPVWAREVPTFQPCAAADLPADYTHGWRYTLPLADMSAYLRWLAERLRAAGVTIERTRISSLEELADQASFVVNCAGLGARELVDDKELEAVRGQLLVVKNPGVDWFFQEFEEDTPAAAAEPGEMTYFLPHGAVVVLGGCARRDGEGLEPDEVIRDRIRERCAQVEPLLGDAEFLADRVGLRPARPMVRVEAEEIGGRPVVHNYGHGGAGLTLSWGCAGEVLRLVKAW